MINHTSSIVKHVL